ncbi:ferritin-like domain-containing protein [Rhodocytophaga aerolata]|uniref:Ferritin-like domain-containing protein n=1 Tax=Rhodocytophaga aerolata TaxID=455078 RepID=A0ABT8R9Y4_9BACT|nr:ferritin-like domain-containing protein [Rhodocytophaga aerolata]MDO1448149.1 ferritin-like domain-containing protein [Rhodocytophaga aerolata]
MKKNNLPLSTDKGTHKTNAPLNRRSFLGYAGVSVVTSALILSGCKDDEGNIGLPDTGVNLGSGDTGILNYAYALEQLEAAFYTQVIQTKYSGMTAAEEQLLTDLRDHEVAHRDFFKAALGASAIPDLEVDFSAINFSNRTSVLGTAKTFEDLGVSAYNGAGKLLTDANLLLIAGKIVSVEARHAAAIRSLINPNSADFSGDDVVDAATGLDVQRMPGDVLMLASPFIKTKINANNLPTT